MNERARAGRLAKRIGEIVATAIEHEIKDPQMEYITVTDARLTADLRDATVFYTVRGRTLDEEPDLEAAKAALDKARGQLRTIVGRQTGVKFTPTLTFVADTVPDAARHMEELLAKARASDELVRRSAAGATPAGEADPYKRAEAGDEDSVEAGDED